MTIEELRNFSKVLSAGFLICWPVIAFELTFGANQTYTKCIGIMSLLFILCCITNLILLHFKRFVLQVFYFGVALLLNLFGVTFYLLTADLLKPTVAFSKTLIFINIFIISLTLMIKRLFIKNEKFIQALKDKKHKKYILSDLILALIVGLVVIFVAKQFDSTHLQQVIKDGDTLFRILTGYILLVLGDVAYIYSMAFYFYEARFRKIKSK